jgi:dipeptidyl aminopeptidase/acylaminoacyl peptidase
VLTTNGHNSPEALPFEAILTAYTFGEFMPLSIAPDGSVAFAIRRVSEAGRPGFSRSTFHRTGVWSYALGSEIWMVTTDGPVRRLIADQGNNWSPSWSPDGRRLAFCSDRAEPANAERLARLWLWDARRDEQRLVSNANVRSLHMAWSADGRRVLAGILPSGITPQAYARQVVNSPSQASDEPGRAGSSVRVYRALPRRVADDHAPGVLDLDRTPVDLAWIDVESGHIETLVSDTAISAFRLAPNGVDVAYTTPTRYEQTGNQQMLFDLNLVRAGSEPTQLSADIRQTWSGDQFSWSPDSERIAYREFGTMAAAVVHVVARDGSASMPISYGDNPGCNTAIVGQAEAPTWANDSTAAYFVDDETIWRASVQVGAGSIVTRLDGQHIVLLEPRPGQLLQPDGEAAALVVKRDKRTGACAFTRVDLGTGSVQSLLSEAKAYGGYGLRDGYAASIDGRRVIYAAQDAAHSPELHVVDLGSATVSPRRITRINPAFDRYVMGRTRLVEWRTADGEPGRGVLLLPAGYVEGQRYPLITKVYGWSKPTERAATCFGLQLPPVDNLQLYATRGYAVFLPNIPLDDERNTGTVAADVAKIVLPGVNEVVNLGIADPERLGLTGHSFGGYNAIALLTSTTQFKAAMVSAGLANLISWYGAMGRDGSAYGSVVIEHGAYLIHGAPWERPLSYIENSPTFHLDRVVTPLLITHGGSDEVVPPFLAAEIFVGLRRLGRDVTYVLYEGEDHHQAGWSLSNQLDYWKRTVAFFDEYLKAETKQDTAAGPRL